MKFSKTWALALTLVASGCTDRAQLPLPDMNDSSLVNERARRLPLGGDPDLRGLFGSYAHRKCLEAAGVIPPMTSGPPPATVGEAIEEQRSLALVYPRPAGDTGRRTRPATEVVEERDLIGPWKVPREGKRDCHQPLTFHPNGRWDTPSAAAEGNWSLQGNVLTLRTAAGQVSLRLLRTDGSTLDVENAQGRTLRLNNHLL